MSRIVVSDALRTSSPDFADDRLERVSISSSGTLRLLAYVGDQRASHVPGAVSTSKLGDEQWFSGLLRWGPSLPVWVAVHAARVAAKRESLSLEADQLGLEAFEAAQLFALAPNATTAGLAQEAAEKISERFNPTKRACLRLACRAAAQAAGRAAKDDAEPSAVADAAWRSFSFAQSATDAAAGEFEKVMADHLIREVLLGREPVF